MTPSAGEYAVLRAADLVVLRIRSRGLTERVGAQGAREWVAADGDGRLIVELPSQHLAESTLESPSMEGRAAGPSSLHVIVPPGRVIPLSAEGVLAAVDALALSAMPRGAGSSSTLELPWRLLLGVEHGARCRHPIRPATNGAGVTAMWHTRVLAPGSSAYSAVFPVASLAAETPFVDSTSLGREVADIAAAGIAHPDQAVAVDKFVLTPGGASFSGSVDYPELVWAHRTALGRDVHAELVEHGVLFPFGHAASTVKITERVVDPDTGVAGLRQTFSLVVTRPSRDYGLEAPHEREFPFHRLLVDPVVVAPLDPPPPGEPACWLRQNREPVMFTVRASSAGDVVSWHLPLIFAKTGTAVEHLRDLYARGPRDEGRPPETPVDRAVPLVVQRQPDGTVTGHADTEQHVLSIIFDAVAMPSSTAHAYADTDGTTAIVTPGDPGFHPRIDKLDVTLPATAQLLKQHDVIRATLDPAVKAATAAAPPEALLRFPGLPMNFSAAPGALAAAPAMTVDRIRRLEGPTVGDLPTDPAQMFDRAATVLGIVPLVDLIEQVTGRPKIVWSRTPSPHATLTWKEHLKRTKGPFQPLTDSTAELRVEAEPVAGDLPRTTIDGTLTAFAVGIPSPLEGTYLLKLEFATLKFRSAPRSLPETSLKITSARFGKQLKFLQKLSSFLPVIGSKAPAVEVGTTAVRVQYDIAVSPPPAIGVFALRNLLVQVGLSLPLDGKPVTVDCAFGVRDHPFLLTVMGFGGGGYLELSISPGGADGGLRRFVGGIEFGAAVVMNFGVAVGEVHVLGGVVFAKKVGAVLGSAATSQTGTGAEVGTIELTGYLRIGGSVRVLGLITVSVELVLSLTFTEPNKLSGEARLVIAVDLTFWSTSVEISCHKEFLGSEDEPAPDGRFALDAVCPPSVRESLGPDGSSFPWRTYCQAFAGS